MAIFRQFRALINSKYYWLFILAGGYLLRALAGLYFQNAQLPDFYSQYAPGAEAIAAGMVRTGQPPGYMFFLAPIVMLFGKTHYIYPAILIQSALSILLCYILYKITVSVFHSETAGRLAAGIAAFYPWLIYYSAQLSIEHWFVFWVAASVYYSIEFDKKRDYFTAFKLGLTLAVTIYTRTVFAPYIVLALAVFVLRKIAWRKILIIILLLAGFILFWGNHNQRHTGVWTFTGGNADHNLYIALNPMNKTGGAIWGRDAPSFDEVHTILSGLPPEQQKTWYKDEVKKFVLENPGQVLMLTAKKMFIFWRPYPTADGYANVFTVAVIFFSFVPLVILSVYALWIFRKNENYVLLAYPLLYIIQLNAIHLVFAGSLVYRFPIEPLLICLSSYGLSRLLKD